MKLLKFTFLFILVFSYFSFGQVKHSVRFHPFTSKVVFSSEFGYSHSYTDYVYSMPKLVSKGTIEFFLPVKSSNALGLKVTSGIGNLSAYGRNDNEKFNNPYFNTNIFFIGTGITYVSRLGYSNPYLSLTVSNLRIDPRNRKNKLLPNNLNREYNLSLSMYTAELGVRFLLANFWSLNFGMTYNLTNSDYIDDLEVNNQNDKFLTLFMGISFYYSGTKSNDSDCDGIIDSKDMCPETPCGTIVDEFGCPQKSEAKKTTIKNEEIVVEKEAEKENFVIPQKEVVIIKEKKLPKKEIIKKEASVKGKTKFKKTNKSYQFTSEKSLPDLFFTDGNLYCFQVEEFETPEAAKIFKDKLLKGGHHSFIIKVKKNGEVWFKVRVGYFKSLKSAKKYKTLYKTKY